MKTVCMSLAEEEYNLMKKYGGTCLKCGCKNSIQEKRVLSDEERSEIEEIEKKVIYWRESNISC